MTEAGLDAIIGMMVDIADAEVRAGIVVAQRRPEHTPGIFAATDRSRDHLRPWFPWVEFTRTVEDVEARYLVAAAQYASGELVEFVILDGATIVGKVDVHSIKRAAGTALLGYWLAADGQGRGLMRAALTHVIGRCFAEFGLQRLELRTAVQNVRSRRLAEALAFELRDPPGVVSPGDLGEDAVYYAMTANRWSHVRTDPVRGGGDTL